MDCAFRGIVLEYITNVDHSRILLGNIPRERCLSYYSPIKIRYFHGNRRALRIGASHKNPTRRWRYQNKTIVLF